MDSVVPVSFWIWTRAETLTSPNDAVEQSSLRFPNGLLTLCLSVLDKALYAADVLYVNKLLIFLFEYKVKGSVICSLDFWCNSDWFYDYGVSHLTRGRRTFLHLCVQTKDFICPELCVLCEWVLQEFDHSVNELSPGMSLMYVCYKLYITFYCLYICALALLVNKTSLSSSLCNYKSSDHLFFMFN